MPKVVSMNGAHPHAETFDPLLPVELVLPFPGHWGQIRAIYSVAGVYNLAEQWDAIMTDIQESAKYADQAAQMAETPEEKRRATLGQAHIRRHLNLRIIGTTVVQFTWPFKGSPPAPTDTETLEKWPDPILNWLSDAALQEVRRRVDDPKLLTGSAPT